MSPSVHLTESYWPAEHSAELLELSLGEALRATAQRVPDRVGLVLGAADSEQRQRWTYRELLAEAEQAAYALLQHFTPGDRVAIWSTNRPEFEFLQLGASLAGLTLVMVNPALKRDEVRYILGQSRSTALFLDDAHAGGSLATIAESVRPELPGLSAVFRFSEWAQFLAGADRSVPLPDVDPGSVAQIQYTSGTTGFPKGAMLYHCGLVTNAHMGNERSQVDFGGVFVNPLPMFHVGSCTLSVIGAIVRDGTHVMVPRFDPALVLELIESERGTMLVTVPTVLHALLAHPDLARRDLSSLKTLFCGGASAPTAMIERTKAAFGCFFTSGWGMTEAHGTATQTAVTDSPQDQSSTVGRPLPLAEAKVIDVVTGETVPVGAQGEVCLRGYQTMRGYFDRPEETLATKDASGWLHTGDLGRMDERGLIRIDSRLKDMIIRGGENVYPAEVENVLFDHRSVEQVQVVGVEDEKWGEQVCAVIKSAADDPADPRELWAYCRERIAGFKVPRLWCLIEEFPTTASGKIQKFALRDLIASGELKIEWSADDARATATQATVESRS